MQFARYICVLLLLGSGATAAFAHTIGEPGTHTIHMNASGFDPATLVVRQGDTVVFENIDSRKRWPASNIHPTHTVYPGSGIEKCGTDEEENIFDACRELPFGEVYAFTFDTSGRWRFHDHLWPQLSGEITVVGGGVPEPEASDEKRRPLSVVVDDALKSLARSLGVFLESLFSSEPEVRLDEVSVVAISSDREALVSIVRGAGPKKVMTRLLEETGGGSALDCHQQAHQVGRTSYEIFGASAFEEGDASCHSGYYHGAMEAFLAERGTKDLAKNIKELCDSFDTSFGVFECLHGVGHGVMAYENYDLSKALGGCEELSDTFSTRSCYGGVFMENIVTGQGLGAIPGHETEWVSDDPHFPCNAIGDSFDRRHDCYQMQTSWMLTLTGYNFPEVVEECREAPEDMVGVCYRSLGRDAAGYTLRDPDRILAICKYVPDEHNYYNECISGAVNVVIDFWGPKLEGQAQALCDRIPKEAAKQYCTSIVENRMPGLFGSR